jgi:hypothetical protein
MSAASVRTSSRCDNFPVLSHGGREQERTGLAAEAGCFQVFVEELSSKMTRRTSWLKSFISAQAR